MDLLKEKIMQCWNPKFKKVKVWQRWSDSRLKWLKCVLFLTLSIGMSYYQEGCNIDHLTWSKVLIGHPSENPERKPCKTNSKILGWSNLGLVDQVKPFNWDLVFSDPDRSDQSQGLTGSFSQTSLGDRSDWSALTVQTANFWKFDLYPLTLSYECSWFPGYSWASWNIFLTS